jgi:hypothetical protein
LRLVRKDGFVADPGEEDDVERKHRLDREMVDRAVEALRSGDFDWVVEAVGEMRTDRQDDPAHDWADDLWYGREIWHGNPPPALGIRLVLRGIEMCESDAEAVDRYGWKVQELIEDRVIESTRLLSVGLSASERGRAIRDSLSLDATDLLGEA